MKKREQIADRCRSNTAMLPAYTDYIFNQRSPKVERLRYGRHGHIGAEGCGAVAIHNVMKFIGREQDFCGILRDMEELNMPWLGGRFGTKPHSLGRYFRLHHVPFEQYSSPNDFKAALLTHRIGIVNTWNRRLCGMHFYCVYYSAEENKYYSANLYTPSAEFRPTPLSEISSLRFVVGYTV